MRRYRGDGGGPQGDRASFGAGGSEDGACAGVAEGGVVSGGPAGPVAPVVGGGTGNPGGLDGHPLPSGVHGSEGAAVTIGRRLHNTRSNPPTTMAPIAAATAPQRNNATP